MHKCVSTPEQKLLQFEEVAKTDNGATLKVAPLPVHKMHKYVSTPEQKLLQFEEVAKTDNGATLKVAPLPVFGL